MTKNRITAAILIVLMLALAACVTETDDPAASPSPSAEPSPGATPVSDTVYVSEELGITIEFPESWVGNVDFVPHGEDAEVPGFGLYTIPRPRDYMMIDPDTGNPRMSGWVGSFTRISRAEFDAQLLITWSFLSNAPKDAVYELGDDLVIFYIPHDVQYDETTVEIHQMIYNDIMIGAMTITDPPAEQVRLEFGTVTVVADGVEYEPYRHFMYSLTYESGGYLAADGVPFQDRLDEILPELAVIEYTDDFQVIVTGDGARQVGYELYNDRFERISAYGSADYTLPDEPGEYIFCIVVRWNARYYLSESAGYQYMVKIVRT